MGQQASDSMMPVSRRGQREQQERPAGYRLPGRLHWLVFVAAAAGTSAYLHLQSTRIIARDALYHLAHGGEYLRQGPFMGDFPWLPFSVLGRHGGDIWYGFHLLLAPLGWVADPFLRIEVAGIVTLTLMLVLCYQGARLLQVRLPALWPLLLALLLAWRLAQVRPNTVSIGLAVLLLAVLLRGGWRAVLAVTLALAFFHLAFFWLALALLVVAAAARWACEGVVMRRQALALVTGLFLGWLLRPRPLSALVVLKVQLLDLLAEKGRGRLLFGRELSPMPWQDLGREHGGLFTLWAAVATVVLIGLLLGKIRPAPPERTLLWCTLMLSTGFLGMTVFMSARTVDLWAPFALLLLAGAAGCLLGARASSRPSAVRLAVAAACLGLLLWASWGAQKDYGRKLRRGVPPDRLRAAAEWVAENAPPGAHLFHTNWGIFPELFYWNRQSHYTGGMDPIFQYAFDPSLYWKVHHLQTGRGGASTWGSENISLSPAEPTGVVLRRDFHAAHVLVETNVSRKMYDVLAGDPAYRLVYEQDGVAIFAGAG